MKYDLAALKRLLPTQRHELWKNAKRIDSPEAAAIVELIEASGLDYRANETVRLDDPIGRAMHKVIFSPEGRTAALEATERGLPALAGIDPLLRVALGADYGKHNEATVQAGYLVANLMRQAGFHEISTKPLPSDCIAASGLVFSKKNPKAR